MLRPRTDVLRLNADPLCSTFAGYEVQGVEAIAFSKDQAVAWLLLETKHIAGNGEMVAWLARGLVRGGEVYFDPEQMRKILPSAKVDNLSAEALAIFEREVFVIDEANGPARTGGIARAHRLTQRGALEAIAMLPLCYRVTDATEPDGQGYFWVTNVLCKPGPCEALEALPPGRLESVEQLVQLRIGAGSDAILAGKAPIIRLSNGGAASNWEGVAQLDDLGFLVIADKYPTEGQIFGFVPYRPSELLPGEQVGHK
ncbi:MAG TPA: hypothetical protein VKP30_32745 [Polyangiaceae bacterium]|nr:hypothetical protein [Polyangiaceae bacterium]